jgi:hypothetical protein
MQMTIGSHDNYEWLVSDHDLHTLLERCPEVVVGKYIAITSFDSGPLVPNDDEQAAGWMNEGNIAYTPEIQSVENLPHELYDEWYVFREPRRIGTLVTAEKNIFEGPLRPGHVEAFVNFGAFHLHKPDMKALADLFWEQLPWISPESYIADGECLIYVSSNKELFAKARKALMSK